MLSCVSILLAWRIHVCTIEDIRATGFCIALKLFIWFQGHLGIWCAPFYGGHLGILLTHSTPFDYPLFFCVIKMSKQFFLSKFSNLYLLIHPHMISLTKLALLLLPMRG
jgi:hypothetical protein